MNSRSRAGSKRHWPGVGGRRQPGRARRVDRLRHSDAAQLGKACGDFLRGGEFSLTEASAGESYQPLRRRRPLPLAAVKASVLQ
jgi:hypothetical protein